MENIALWHERDISHSSVERILAPDINIAVDFALNRLSNIIENLIVYPENMEKNLNSLGGLNKSQDILKALIKKGLSRQEAYLNVQSLCTKAWNTKKEFIEILLKDNKIKKIHYLYFDTLIIKDKFRKFGYSKALMNFNKKIIKKEK